MYCKTTVINHGGELPYIDHLDGAALLSCEKIAERCDNPDMLKKDGINHIVIGIYPDHWHIEQVSGYSYEEGMFCEVVG